MTNPAQTNNTLTGNPFSTGGVASADSLSQEDSDVSLEPIFDDRHFPDLEQRYVNREYNTVAERYVLFFFVCLL